MLRRLGTPPRVPRLCRRSRNLRAASHDAVIRVYDSGVPNHRSARAMQDGVLQLRLANRAEFIYDGAFEC
jgi:hypothetical protein